MKGFFYFL